MNQSDRFNAGLLLAALTARLATTPASAQRLVRPGARRLTEKEVLQLEMKAGDTAEQHYPVRAKRDAVDGIVLVDLLLNVEGQVLEAQVVAESPTGFGFGVAALDTAKTFEFINPFKSEVLFSREIAFLP
jgi:TonB family protein